MNARARSAVLSLALLTACGGAEASRSPANPVRREIELALAEVPAGPIDLRFNPAACHCPLFELRVGARWLRAELTGDTDKLQPWTAWLAGTPLDRLPLTVQVRGKVDREVLRTAQGAYAVRVEVAEILAPLPSEPAAPAP